MDLRKLTAVVVMLVCILCFQNCTLANKFTPIEGSSGSSSTSSSASSSSSTSTTDATALSYGANLHDNADYGNGSATAIDTQFQLMQARQLKVARVGGVPGTGANASLQNWVASATKYNLHLIYMLDLSWVVTSDAYTFTSNNTTTIYNNTYQAVYNFVLAYRNDDIDWELGNEIDLKTDNSVAPSEWNTGWQASDWSGVSAYGSTDYYANWAAAIKGAADAIAAINTQYGTNMRRVLNTTSTHLGFLDYMKAQGVNYEVISYHYYQYLGTSPYDLSATSPFSGSAYDWDLFVGLAAYKLPVTIDEMNCAEIYNSSYKNTATDTLYATCLTNLRTQIGLFKNNTELNIESLVAYELLDEPSNTAPENHFGMFWNDGQGNYTPKAHLYLWTAFAGGDLSSSEISVLTSFNLWPLP